MTWKMECSIGGACELGSGLRYREIIVMPLENCSEDGINENEPIVYDVGLSRTDVFAS